MHCSTCFTQTKKYHPYIQFIMPSIVNLRSFIGIRCKLIKIRDRIYTVAPWKTFLCKNWQVMVPVLIFYDFAMDCNETSHI